MQPGNPIIGGTVLRRPAEQSPNFAAGSSGWIIRQDGTAEFNSATLRGTLVVGTGGTMVDISQTLPAALSTYYLTNWVNALTAAFIGFFSTDGSYSYWVNGLTTGGDQLWGMGVVLGNGTVLEQYRNTHFNVSGITQVDLGNNTTETFHALVHGFLFAQTAQIGSAAQDGNLSLLAATPGAVTLQSSRLTDTQIAFAMDRVGSHFWGSGTALTDTTLYRSRAVELATSPIVADLSGGSGGNGEVWHGMTLLNGFANRGAGFAAASYRQVPSPARSVEIKGQVTSGGVAGTVMTTLPAGYRPLTEQPFWAFNNTSNVALLGVVETTGNIQLFGSALAAGNVCQFSGLVSLDL